MLDPQVTWRVKGGPRAHPQPPQSGNGPPGRGKGRRKEGRRDGHEAEGSIKQKLGGDDATCLRDTVWEER